MRAVPTKIPDVLVIYPEIHQDNRGGFFESYNSVVYAEILGSDVKFVQDNHSFSKKDVIRGLHYQLEHLQGKLVRICSGAIYDVAVDLRQSSKTFGQWVGRILTADAHEQHWIPPGFAHGFMVLSDEAQVLYKVTEHWRPEHERSIRWDDPTLAIDWPITGQLPLLSEKDASGLFWEDAPKLE
jgi:dTDP-4-dehydrorhamnose 3,5-epimerase